MNVEQQIIQTLLDIREDIGSIKGTLGAVTEKLSDREEHDTAVSQRLRALEIHKARSGGGLSTKAMHAITAAVAGAAGAVTTLLSSHK